MRGDEAMKSLGNNGRIYELSPSSRFFFFFAISFVILCIKSPDALKYPQFWAEDGAIFYAQQETSAYPMILEPYAGYLHLIPRIVSWLAKPIDVFYTPLFYNVLAIIIDAFCISYILLQTTRTFGSYTIFIALFLLPTIGDIYGTITNVQWFVQTCLVLCLIPVELNAQQGASAREVFIIALIIVGSLTGPFSVILAATLLALYLVIAAARASNLATRIPALAMQVSALEAVQVGIPRARLWALLAGALLQGAIMATRTVKTPSFALTIAERAAFGLSDAHSRYAELVKIPYAPVHLAILSVFISAIILGIVMFALRPTRVSAVICLFLLLGAVQPLLAYLKQRESYVMTSVSHYYYFLGVFSICAISMALKLFIPVYHRGLSAFLIFTLLSFLLLRPEYLIRSPLIQLDWPRYAELIRSSREASVKVPLNPDWLAAIPTRQGRF
jgi:hypothetical protein